jgi:hypothetical protein
MVGEMCLWVLRETEKIQISKKWRNLRDKVFLLNLFHVIWLCCS